MKTFSERRKNLLKPEANIGIVGHISHGKTSLTYALTGKVTLSHSEELKRGITIRLGYAEMIIRKCKACPAPECYTTREKCPKCSAEMEVLRKVSLVDAPGHETLMATMLTGASIMDGAILVIAANEPCPQPQTKEHLLALQISGVEKILIVQNKIELVDEKGLQENYEQIKKFIKGTVAENAPIIPVSAIHSVNIDYLIEAIEKFIPSPKRDLDSDPLFLIARSFDVNKPGTDYKKLSGGVIGGVLKQGRLKSGDEIQISPGLKIGEEWKPMTTKISSIFSGLDELTEATPGGNLGLATGIDPFLTKSDALAGQIAGLPGKIPPIRHELNLTIHLLNRIVGSKEELSIQPLKVNEPLMLNALSSKTVGFIVKVKGDNMSLKLKLPICIASGERVAISRRVGEKWRLIGYGIIS